MGRKISAALKSGGRFLLGYHDGSYGHVQGIAPRQAVFQEAPERINFRSKEYLPEIGAYVHLIRNETRGEEYERKAYIYTIPVVRVIMSNAVALEQHIILDENHFLDVFVRPTEV